MAALTKNHGVRFIDAGEDARTVVVPDFSTIGLIGHAEDADETLFPLNKNVQIFGDEVEKIEKLGLIGDLPPAIDALLAEGINPSVIIRRVAKETTANAQLGAIIGDPSTRTGIWGFLDGKSETGVKPGLLVAPGYTGAILTGVMSVNVTAGGTGYVTAPAVTFAWTGATVLPKGEAVVSEAGAVTGVKITDAGFGGTGSPTISFGGPGTGATATAVTGSIANPVAKTLSAVAKKLLAIAVIDGPNLGRTEAALWAEKLKSDDGRYLYAVDPAVRRFEAGEDGVESILTRPSAISTAALFAKRDRERGGPYWSPENQTFTGIVGTARSVSYYDGEVDHDANFLVSAGVNTIIEGKELFGSETLSNDTNWRFVNKVRTENAIRAALPAAVRKWRGENFTAHNALMIVKTIEFFLDELVSLGVVVGYTRYFDRGLNPNANMRQGILRIELPHENTPIISDLQIGMRPHIAAFDILAEQIQQALGTLSIAA